MAQMSDLLEHQPGYEDVTVMQQALTKSYYGRVRDSRVLLQLVLDNAERHKNYDAVGEIEATMLSRTPSLDSLPAPFGIQRRRCEREVNRQRFRWH
jgi:hypothetical protein